MGIRLIGGVPFGSLNLVEKNGVVPNSGGGGFSPLDLAPALWFDASDPATLFDSTSGGSLVAPDGTIARWEDKSGNSRHATQGTAGARPARKTAIKNGLDIVRFGGSHWMASVPFGGTETWETHMVIVSRQTQYTIFAAWAGGSFDPNPGGGYMAVNASGQFECIQSGGPDPNNTSTRVSTGNILANDEWAAVAEVCGSTHAAHSLRANGALLSMSGGFANNPGSFTKTATAFGLGGWNGGAAPSRCDIAEVVHFTRNLTSDERAFLEAYWTKWGIVITP